MHRAMNGLSRVGVLAGLLLGATTPALACRVNLQPEERIETGYRSKIISAVALVRIEAAGYTGAPVGDAHPWRASATIGQMIEGHAAGQTVEFEQGFGSAACDHGYPPPAADALWVVYYWRDDKGVQRVWEAYPLAVARAADKRFGAKMP